MIKLTRTNVIPNTNPSGGMLKVYFDCSTLSEETWLEGYLRNQDYDLLFAFSAPAVLQTQGAPPTTAHQVFPPPPIPVKDEKRPEFKCPSCFNPAIYSEGMEKELDDGGRQDDVKVRVGCKYNCLVPYRKIKDRVPKRKV